MHLRGLNLSRDAFASEGKVYHTALLLLITAYSLERGYKKITYRS